MYIRYTATYAYKTYLIDVDLQRLYLAPSPQYYFARLCECAIWLSAVEGFVNGYVETHDARRRLEDNGRNKENFWLKRASA